MRFAFIARHRHIWPVSWLCKALEVSRSGFHAWLNRPASTREIHDAKLVTAIETSFKASDRTYGARDVLEEGLGCGLHRIERLMRLNALRARPRRRGKPKDDDERSVIAGNILDRDFQADRPNQKWLAEPEVAGRLHLYLDRRGLAVCRGRAGPVFAARRRLVHEGRPGCVTGHGCADDGGLATWKGRRASPSFRSGVAIHQ